MRDVVSSAQVPGGAPEHVPAPRRERSSLVAELPAYVCDADRPVQRAGGVGDAFVDPVSVMTKVRPLLAMQVTSARNRDVAP